MYEEVDTRPALARNDAYLCEKRRLLDCVDSVVRDLGFLLSDVRVIMSKLEWITAMVSYRETVST